MTNEELFAWLKRNPISIGCGVLSLGLAIAIYFRLDEISEAEAALTQKSTVAERHTLNLANSAHLKEQLESITAANKEIDARIIHGNQYAKNAQYFYILAAETGVNVVNFQQSPAGAGAKQAKSTFTPVGFRVSVQGSFTQVLDFLRMIEAGTHYSRVLTATVSGSPANRKAPLTLALSLELLGLP